MADKGIAIGSDEAGYLLKNELLEYLKILGVAVTDYGCHSLDPVDYPDVAIAVATAVARGEHARAILICGTGIGMSIAANKIPGVDAALAHDVYSAARARMSNNAQVLTLGARVIGVEVAKVIVKTWLDAEFAGGNSARKVDKIRQAEQTVRAPRSDNDAAREQAGASVTAVAGSVEGLTVGHRPLVVAGMKMNLTATEAAPYFGVVRQLVRGINGCDIAVLPPFTAIWVARERLTGSNVAWGAQDLHAKDAGAYTGDISAPMLVDLGCSFVEVGHAERRRDHCEQDDLVAAKLRQVLRYGMTPILCVGEPRRMSPQDAVAAVIHQVGAALTGVSGADRARVVIAYEPVWAIGDRGVAANVALVAGVCEGIRDWLASGPHEGGCRIIYGGSVDPDTAEPMLENGAVDGLFVGRAALDPFRFAAIAAAAAAHALIRPTSA